MSMEHVQSEEKRSSVTYEAMAKGFVKVTVKCYEGTSEAEMQRIEALGYETFKSAEARANPLPKAVAQ